MALNFSDTTTNKVNHGTNSVKDDIHANPFTVFALARRDTDAANMGVCATGGLFGAGWALNVEGGTNGNLQFVIERATNTNYITSTVVLPLNTWAFIACTYDDALGTEVDIYYGTETAVMVEASYNTTDNGVGSIDSDAGDPLVVGNFNATATNSFGGDIAWVGIFTRRMTLDEIIYHQLNYQYRASMDPDNLFSCEYGWTGTGTQPELGGRPLNGTVTGATVIDHPGLYPYSGIEDDLAPFKAAVAATDQLNLLTAGQHGAMNVMGGGMR